MTGKVPQDGVFGHFFDVQIVDQIEDIQWEPEREVEKKYCSSNENSKVFLPRNAKHNCDGHQNVVCPFDLSVASLNLRGKEQIILHDNRAMLQLIVHPEMGERHHNNRQKILKSQRENAVVQRQIFHGPIFNAKVNF